MLWLSIVAFIIALGSMLIVRDSYHKSLKKFESIVGVDYKTYKKQRKGNTNG